MQCSLCAHLAKKDLKSPKRKILFHFLHISGGQSFPNSHKYLQETLQNRRQDHSQQRHTVFSNDGLEGKSSLSLQASFEVR